MKIRMDDIEPNPYQHRKNFNGIDDLSKNIEIEGIINIISVRVKPDDHSKYQIVDGERRYRACKLLEWIDIEVNVIDKSDKDMEVAALTANIFRDDIDEIEKAETLRSIFMKISDDKIGDTVSPIMKQLSTLHHNIDRNKPYDTKLNDLCIQVGISPRRIIDYLKISTLDDDLKVSFKDKTKRSVLEVNKFLTDLVKLVDSETEKAAAEKETETETHEANLDQPQKNSLVGGQSGPSVHDYMDVNGNPLPDRIKYPNKPLDSKIDEPYVHQQYSNTNPNHTKSNKRTNAIKDIKAAYREVGDQIDSKELSVRTKLAEKIPVEHKANVIRNTEVSRIAKELDKVDLLDDTDFLDKQITDKPDERLLKKRIEQYQLRDDEKPKDNSFNIKSAEKNYKNLIKMFDRVEKLNMTLLENLNEDQLREVKKKMKATYESLGNKIKTGENNVEN